jgi:hypothetical protein
MSVLSLPQFLFDVFIVDSILITVFILVPSFLVKHFGKK